MNLTANSDISVPEQRRRDVIKSGPMKSEAKLVGFMENLLKKHVGHSPFPFLLSSFLPDVESSGFLW